MKVFLGILALLLVISSVFAECNQTLNESCIEEKVVEPSAQPSPWMLILLMVLFTMTASFMVGKERAHHSKRRKST